MKNYSIVIHGGAGTILKKSMTAGQEINYTNALLESLKAGDKILKEGGTALDAIEAAIVKLEDNPLFNAGKGSVFTHEGKIEMDASIMDGKTLMAGAVSGVSNIKNPARLARAVMEKSEHVFLSGKGAEEFAKINDLEFESDEYFFTRERHDQLLLIKDSNNTMLDHTDQPPADTKFGTCGAVACDNHGNIAACTSTGGMTNKRYGRIGDTPIIGAGTYANNKTCAVSCTGHGEYFIRAVVAYDISCLMEYKGLSLREASEFVVNKKLVDLKGEGGIIAVDAMGNVAWPFNSEGMYRGLKQANGDFIVKIYKENTV